MKNKKLFAILTLVCFMFTLMPVAAFAVATPVDPADYAVKVTVGSEAPAEDVYVVSGTTMSALAYKGTTPLTNGTYYAVNANGEGVQIGRDDSNVGVQFAFKLPGTYTIYGVVDATGLDGLVRNANDLTNDQTVADAVKKIEAQLDAKIIKTVAYVTVEAPEANYTVDVIADSFGDAYDSYVELDADSGFASNEQVTVQLKNNGRAIVGKVPTITAPDYVTVVPANAKKVVTDAAGKITYNISANRAGNFKVVFSYEDAEDATVTVKVNDEDIANIEVVKESANPVNKAPNANNQVNTGATLKFTDANGSVIDKFGAANADTKLIGTDVKVTVVSQPATSKLTADKFELVDSQTAGASDLVVNTTSDLKVGTYEVKFALENGKYVVVAFEAAKMGDVVGIRFVQPATTVALNAASPSFRVQSYDANGVTETLVLGDDYVLNAQGKALVEKGANTFKVSNEDKYIGTTVSVLAKTTDDKFVATTTLEVVDNGMEVVYVDTTAEVGVTTVLAAKVVDAKGNKVAVPTKGEGYDMKVVVLDKPANAYVYAAAEIGATAKDIAVTFLGSVAGEYKIQTIVVDDNNEYVTGIETIKVGNNEGTFKDVIVMSIGANKLVKNDTVVEMPAAPEIVDSRTMVPARAGLEAFGATVVWDEATQSVTAELGGVKVVMVIGEKAYTVNGKTVVGDAAPYITAASTMVPVSFFTNAFGITATPIYDANGVCDVLFTK